MIIYRSGRNVDDVINDLQFSAEKFIHYFSDNQMKGNTDKCHLIMSFNIIIHQNLNLEIL